MRTWFPLWSGVVKSSLWDEPDYVVKVFLTMMALKDADHIYRGNAYNLSKESRKTEDEVMDALRILAAPDKIRKERQEFGGRRIKAVEDGWLILNGEKYREMVKSEMLKLRNRKAQAAWRARQKEGKGPLLPGEAINERSWERGDGPYTPHELKEVPLPYGNSAP